MLRLVLALLLVVAQGLTLVHALEHFDGSDHDEHGNAPCDLCILGADLDHPTGSAEVPLADLSVDAGVCVVTPNPSVTDRVLAYRGRAPPVSPYA